MRMKKLLLFLLTVLMLSGFAQAAVPVITFVSGNSTNFTYNASLITSTANTISLPLVGSGVANLTFYGPNITGQTNITVGYKATNSTSIKVTYSNSTVNNTFYVITDGTVTNPIITISADTSASSSNLPGAVIVGGAVTAIVAIYTIRRRNR
jgi:hypothetical protein